MDGANWRPTQGADPAAVAAAAGVDPNAPAPAPTGGDWRAQLDPEARSRIVSKVMETLKKHLPVPVPEGLSELQKIAVRFEEKIYTAATNQSDYFRKISLKMFSVESQTKSQQNPGNARVIPNPNPPAPGGYNLMSCIKEIPTLKGDNYTEWKKKIDLAFILAEVDWVVTSPCPTEPVAPVRETNEADAAWATKERDFESQKMSYHLEHRKWFTANKKCLAVIKNTIEPAILGSIPEYHTVTEYLDRIKSQFTGSSKTYATQLIKQLVTERYSGNGGVREHILRMSNLASKLKPMDLALKEEFLIHLIFASLPKEFDTFVVNYNIQPEKWDLERLMAMCVQEEERIKAANGGTINYVKDNKKKNYNANSSSKSKGKGPHQPQQNKFTVEKNQCLHCKKTGHYKKDCPDFLKMIMAKKGIPFDEDYAKKRKTH